MQIGKHISKNSDFSGMAKDINLMRNVNFDMSQFNVTSMGNGLFISLAKEGKSSVSVSKAKSFEHKVVTITDPDTEIITYEIWIRKGYVNHGTRDAVELYCNEAGGEWYSVVLGEVSPACIYAIYEPVFSNVTIGLASAFPKSTLAYVNIPLVQYSHTPATPTEDATLSLTRIRHEGDINIHSLYA